MRFASGEFQKQWITRWSKKGLFGNATFDLNWIYLKSIYVTMKRFLTFQSLSMGSNLLTLNDLKSRISHSGLNYRNSHEHRTHAIKASFFNLMNENKDIWFSFRNKIWFEKKSTLPFRRYPKLMEIENDLFSLAP